jgi:hypothetical protein
VIDRHEPRFRDHFDRLVAGGEPEVLLFIAQPVTDRYWLTVGSTLLLKGLEADVAMILNPEVMDHNHLYVAMTRGSRTLVIEAFRNLCDGRAVTARSRYLPTPGV